MSLRTAINGKCKDCIYDPLADGTWRKQVDSCVDIICPLHPYRPRCKQKNATDKRPQPDGLRRYLEAKQAHQ